MSRLKKFWLTFVSIISAVCLMAGMGLHIAFADDPEPENGYSDKLIARYTLDEIREETDEEQTIKYFDAIDKDMNPLPDMAAQTNASVFLNAMEGKGAGSFRPGNMQIPAFLDSDATGFSVSGWLINHGNDWNILFRYGEMWAPGTGEIGLPNPTYRIAEEPHFANTVPGPDNKFNGGEWDSFMNTDAPYTSNNINEYMYITVSVDANNGLTYYKDGVKHIHYPNSHPLHIEGYTINNIVTTCIQAAKDIGIVFGDNNLYFDDLRISSLLTDEEVAELYNHCASLSISKIYKNGEALKEFDYDQVSAGIPYESPEWVVNYLKDFEDPEGDPNDNLEPEITFEASVISSENSEGAFGYLTPLGSSDFTVTLVDETEHVDEGDLTIYYKVYSLTKGDISKLIKIKFIKNNSIDEARKLLTEIKVDNVLIDGFEGPKKDYTYNLDPTVTEIPNVTYTAMMPEDVTVTDNADEEFDGKEFVYTIEISYEDAVISVYTITFVRESSAIARTLTIDGNGIYNFKGNIYYDEDAQTGIQNAYVKTAITDISKVAMTVVYPSTAEIVAEKCSIDPDSKDITMVVKDTVSDEEKTYLIKQIEFDEETMLAKTVEFGSGEGYTLQGGAQDKDGYVDLGETGYIDIDNFMEGIETINPDGVTLVTWMRMPNAAANTWAGIMTLTESNGIIIVNNNMVLTGDYPLNGAWTNEGWANNSDRFKSSVYKLVALQITPGKAVLYVDGALIVVADSRINISLASDIGFGRSHVTGELLGSGYYKDFRVYNAPISVATINDIYNQQEAAFLTSLKFEGEASNIKNFSGRSFNYELDYSSDVEEPTADDFPKLEAANGLGALDQSKIVASAVQGKSITYAITSEANGFTYVYTVTINLVGSNKDIAKISILYSGEISDFTKELTVDDFTLTDGVMVATVKVWKDFDLSAFVIEYELGEGQSAENEVIGDDYYSIDVYAADSSFITYRINFVVDDSVPNPDAAAQKGNLGLILGIVFGSLGGVIIIVGGVVLALYLSKKSKK